MIEKYLSYGHENAISYEELCELSGLTPREVRREIESCPEIVLNLQDGKGFFLFDPHTKCEREFARKYSAQEKARGWSCIRKALRVDSELRKTRTDVFNGNLYRMARLLKGSTIEVTAEAIGVYPSELSKAENGTLTLSDSQIRRLEEFTGLELR